MCKKNNIKYFEHVDTGFAIKRFLGELARKLRRMLQRLSCLNDKIEEQVPFDEESC